MNRVKSKIKLFIVFTKKPNKTTVDMIKLYGIGIKLLLRNKLGDIDKKVTKKKKKPKLKPKKIIKRSKPKKMSRVDIFISSHQEIKERQDAKIVIEDFFPTYKFPLNPILVEEDSRYDISQTDRCINKNLGESEWFLGILGEEYRPFVNKEVKKVFKLLNSDEVMLFVKSSKKCKTNWKKLLEWVKKQNTVKYQEFTDSRDFERKLKRCLMLKIKEFHKKNNIPFLE